MRRRRSSGVALEPEEKMIIWAVSLAAEMRIQGERIAEQYYMLTAGRVQSAKDGKDDIMFLWEN